MLQASYNKTLKIECEKKVGQLMISKICPVCKIQNYSHGTKGNHIGPKSGDRLICYSLNVYIDEHYFGTFEFVKAQNT